MADFDFKSTGARIGDRLRKTLVEQEIMRRQGLLDGFSVQNTLRQQAREDTALRRQAALDEANAKQLALENQRNDRDFTARQEAAQLARVANADQDAHSRFTLSANVAQKDKDRATDIDENEKRRRHERERDAANNASDERRTAMGSGPANKPADDRAGTVLDALDELSEKINTQDGLRARAGGAWGSVAARANYDDDIAEYSAVLDGAVPIIARRMGHTGVLTQADVDSVKAMFPKPGDGKTLRDRKITRIRSLMGGGSGSPSGRTGSSSNTSSDWTTIGNARVRERK